MDHAANEWVGGPDTGKPLVWAAGELALPLIGGELAQVLCGRTGPIP